MCWAGGCLYFAKLHLRSKMVNKEHQTIFFCNCSCSILFIYYCSVVAMTRKSSRSHVGRAATCLGGFVAATPSQSHSRKVGVQAGSQCLIHQRRGLAALVPICNMVSYHQDSRPRPSRTWGVSQVEPVLVHVDAWWLTHHPHDTVVLTDQHGLARVVLCPPQPNPQMRCHLIPLSPQSHPGQP